MGTSDIIAANNAKAATFSRELNTLLRGNLPTAKPNNPGVIEIVGATGPVGPPGASGGASYLIDEYTSTVDGYQTRSYAQPLAVGSNVYINGLKQSASSFTVSGSSITLPAELNICVGDLITIEH